GPDHLFRLIAVPPVLLLADALSALLAVLLMVVLPPRSTLFPYTTLFRSQQQLEQSLELLRRAAAEQQMNALANQAQELARSSARSEEHTSELQSRENLVCRLLLEKKKHDTKLSVEMHASISQLHHRRGEA